MKLNESESWIMIHCPECGKAIEDIEDTEDVELVNKTNPNMTPSQFIKTLVACGDCGAALGVSTTAIS